MIEVKALTKKYGDFVAVDGVSFDAPSGTVIGLLGPNGAGKTTIMKALTGYHYPSSGTAVVDGKDVVADPVGAKAAVGYLPEGVPLYPDMGVAEYLGFVAEARSIPKPERRAAVDRVVELCGLSGFAGVRIDRLSKGYKQRTGLAQAIIHDPPVLVLDEPTTGLDPNQILEIRSLIRSLGSKKTVLLSTHILQEVEALCSEVLILNEGRIAAQGEAAAIADGLKGEERLECSLRLAAGLDLAELKSSPAVKSAEFALHGSESAAGGRAGTASLRVVAAYGEGDAAAEAVFDWAASGGAKLLEMRRQKMSMEDIFVRLTSEERDR